MARQVHAAGLRERQNMSSQNPSGKWDVGYFNEDGWHHITRVSDEEDAIEAAHRLEDPSDEARNLIGLDGSEDIEVRQVP